MNKMADHQQDLKSVEKLSCVSATGQSTVDAKRSYVKSTHQPRSMFASNTIAEHLWRGIVGVSALVWALKVALSAPLFSVSLVLLALLAFRGCPMCWSIGLAETLYRKWSLHSNSQ